MHKAVFLDRDGVINIEKDYIYKIEDFDFTDGIFQLLKYFRDLGYLLFIITNQSGIGRGYYTEQDYEILTNWMLEEFKKEDIIITKVYFCPDHPIHGIGIYKRESFFRKPNPGMILQAQKDYSIDLESSILIGDKKRDIEAGENAGIGKNILVDDKIIRINNLIELLSTNRL